MNKRLYSLLVAGSMVFSMLPVNVLAEEVSNEEVKEKVQPECDCTEQCISEEEEVIKSECPVCGVENADVIKCIAKATFTAEPGDTSGEGYSYTANNKTLTVTSNEGIFNWYNDENFYDLRNTITMLVIKSGVTEVSDFNSYISLTTVNIPASVTTIEIMNGVFEGCTSLSRLTVDEDNKYYKASDNVLFNYDGTRLLFYAPMKSGTTYTIPETVKSINEFAFRDCLELTSVTITDNVSSIGVGTFYNCKELITVILPATAPSVETLAFPDKTSLYIPANALGYDKGLWGDEYKDRLTTIKNLAFDNINYDIPASTVGIAISDINVSAGAEGGIKPYIFTATGLPDGITMNSAGIISGKPTTAGAAGTATITVTDSASTIATQSITINYGEIIDHDIFIVSTAKAAVESTTFANTTQATHANEATIKNYVNEIATTAVNSSSVIVTVTNTNYTAPIAGTSSAPAGTNGSYVFTITVSKGNQSQTTTQKSITIEATAYSGVSDTAAVAAAKTAVVDGMVSVSFGADQKAKTAAVQTYINGLLNDVPNAVGVSAIVTYTSGNSYSVALSKGNAIDSKSILMTINEFADPDIAIVSTAKVAVESATFANTTQATHANETDLQNYVNGIATTAVNNVSVIVAATNTKYTAPIAGTSTAPAGTNGSYVFTITVSKGNQVQTTTQKSITIAATPYSSGGGSTGGSSSSSSTMTPPSLDNVNNPIETEIRMESVVDDQGHALVEVSDKMMKDAISEAKKNGNKDNGITLILNVETGNKAVNEITVKLPKSVQEQVIKAKIMNTLIVVENLDIQIKMDLDAVIELNKQAKSDISINAKKVTDVGNRPAFELAVNYGDNKQLEDFKKGIMTVSIPYTLQNNEIAGNVYAVHLDENNQEQRIDASSYDSMEKVVRFSTNHFSTYGVGYKQDVPTMSDIASHWAKEEIEYVVARGLLVGSSDSMFYPDSAVSRDMLVSALAIMSDIDEDMYTDWAIKNKLFTKKSVLDEKITREEMAMILIHYAKSQDFILPRTREAIHFSDDSKISDEARDAVQAMQMAGVMMGKDKNSFDPTSSATRSEVSVALKRYNELLMDLSTAQGFDKNDSGSIFYYEAGKLVTGHKTILGREYEFGKDGILIKTAQPREQWVADGTHWTYVKDGVPLRNSWIASDATGSKWYYVNNEGQMVRSTTIHGYVIDDNGIWTK